MRTLSVLDGISWINFPHIYLKSDYLPHDQATCYWSMSNRAAVKRHYNYIINIEGFAMSPELL